MEDLFSTTLVVNNHSLPYRVHFENEQYVFKAAEEGGAHPSFAFSRAHDAWETAEDLPPALQQQATEALDRYLLQQH